MLGFLFYIFTVGGGTAGCVIANRLSEGNSTVLVIEAGGHPFPLTHIPGLVIAALNHPEIDWQDKVVPQEKANHAYKENVIQTPAL